VYFSEFELAELYGSGQETGKQHLQFFDPSLARWPWQLAILEHCSDGMRADTV